MIKRRHENVRGVSSMLAMFLCEITELWGKGKNSFEVNMRNVKIC